MKRLIVMRHAKSAWDTNARDDHARPLNGRGRKDAPRMGAELRERGWVPDRVVSSDSQRTRETWQGVRSELGEIEAEFTRKLYHAGPREVLDVMESLDEEETLLVLGHNPGWQDVVEFLSGTEVQMTTANCALLEGEGDWMDLARTSAWSLIEVLRPKEL